MGAKALYVLHHVVRSLSDNRDTLKSQIFVNSLEEVHGR